MRRILAVSVILACSSSDLHPPLLPDCPTCITNPIIYIGVGDSSVQDGTTPDASPMDASGDVSLDSPDGE